MGYRAIAKRNWRLATVFTAACVVAIIGAFPRLYGIALAMGWFDGGIFGRYPSDAVIVLQSHLNLTEGLLLYTFSFVPFLLLFGIFGLSRSALRIQLFPAQ
jgi:hypothetical protein